MTSVCKIELPICVKSSECIAKEAIQSLNNVLLSTIEEIDEHNVEYTTDVTTKWMHLAKTINEAYKIILNENLKYSDVTSNISKILSGEHTRQATFEESSHLFEEPNNENEPTVQNTSSKISTEVKPDISLQETSSTPKDPIDEPLGILSPDHLELLKNYEILESTTNNLIKEYLDINHKTWSFIDSQNSNSTRENRSEMLKQEVNELIEELNESINDFPEIDFTAMTPTKEPQNDNCSNTEVKMYVLHNKKSASATNLTSKISDESLTIKLTSSTELRFSHYENSENVVQVIKEVVEDFQGYMRKIKQRIDRTKKDFDVLKKMLEGTILDCEKNIIQTKKTKIRSIKSCYRIRSERGLIDY